MAASVRPPRAKSKPKPKRRAPTSPRARRSSRALARVRIVIADDLPMDRAGLASILRSQPDFEVVGEVSTTQEAAKICRDRSPSLLILALRLEAGGGRTPIGEIHAASPKTPVLAVAERGEGHCLVLNPPRTHASKIPMAPAACTMGTDCLQVAVSEGATGTIRRSASADELFRAVRAVAAGTAWYEAGTATAIMRHALAGRDEESDRGQLSSREMEVAELIAAGRSNKEIGSALTISDPTVKKHVGRILKKLGLLDRLQVGLYVARNPLVLRRLEQGRR